MERTISMCAGVGSAWGLFLPEEDTVVWERALKKLLMSGRVDLRCASGLMLCSTVGWPVSIS